AELANDRAPIDGGRRAERYCKGSTEIRGGAETATSGNIVYPHVRLNEKPPGRFHPHAHDFIMRGAIELLHKFFFQPAASNRNTSKHVSHGTRIAGMLAN